MEQTFVMIKPDGVGRGLVGEVIKRLEQKGLMLKAARLLKIDPQLAGEHYREHQGKAFFDSLVDFITSGPVLAMTWEGEQAVATVRNMMGNTDPAKAAPGSMRGDLARSLSENLIHGSDSIEAARREIALFFSESEIY